MRLIITICRTATQESRLYYHEQDSEWTDVDSYLWEEGNYGCDCNRSLFFGRVNDPEFDDAGDCGNGAYTLSIRDDAGAVLYSDNAPDAEPAA